MEVAIAFAEWLHLNRWFHFEKGKWYYTFEGGTAISEKSYQKNYVKSSEELFDIFSKENSKTTKYGSYEDR